MVLEISKPSDLAGQSDNRLCPVFAQNCVAKISNVAIVIFPEAMHQNGETKLLCRHPWRDG
jgi:hypothetical protein